MSKKINKSFLMSLRGMLMHLSDVRTVDGKDLVVDGDIEVGKDIMLVTDDGEYEPAPSGEYDNGKVILVVEAGRITEIRESGTDEERNDEQPEDEQETERMSKLAAIKSAFEESYEKKTRKIYEAIVALGFTDGWIVEAGDTYAVFSAYTPEGEKYIHFDVAWNGEEVTVSNPTEVVSRFVPESESDDTTVQLQAEIETLKSEKETLAGKITELQNQLEAKAAVPPAEEERETTERPLANQLIEAARKRQ